jgi:hypothetical protein
MLWALQAVAAASQPQAAVGLNPKVSGGFEPLMVVTLAKGLLLQQSGACFALSCV